jgi:hypothetical protein
VLERLQNQWVLLTQIAAWLAGLIGAFLIEPPLLWPRAEGTGLWLHLSQFLVAIMAGLFFIGSRSDGRRRKRWRRIAIGAVILGFALFVAYQVLLPNWTCAYRGETVMLGATLSDLGREFLASHQGATCDRLIGSALGVTTQLWPIHELITRNILLSTIYSLAMLSFSAATMSTIEYARGDGNGAQADKDGIVT